MKEERTKFEEFAELAARRKEHLLHRIGQPPKPEGQEGQVYPIPIPAARIADLESVATARGEALGSMLRQWVLERLDDEARPTKGRFEWTGQLASLWNRHLGDALSNLNVR